MRTLLCWLFCLSAFLSTAQDYYITIKGTITDAEDGKPVSYAHVGIPAKGIGTITSYSGRFTLKVPKVYLPASLEVSFLGYKNYRKKINVSTQQLNIRLQRSFTDLQEIIVMDESRVEDIIRRAVGRIPDNYPRKPSSSIGFYRESKTDKNDKYVYLAEGVLELYKTSYKNAKEGQTRVIQGRQIALISPEEMLKQSDFYSGHLSGHRFDFVKNREDFIDEKYFPDYKYWIQNITTYNDRPVYMISFDQEDNSPRGRMKGTIYIDTLSYAFLRAEFEILPDGLRKINDYPLYTGRWKANKYVVQYQQFNDKWYLKEALREGRWRDGGIYTNEYLVTELKEGRARPLRYNDRVGREESFLEVTGEYDEDFWKQYNTAPLGSELQETVQQLQNNQKAQEVFDSTFMAKLQKHRDSLAVAQNGSAVDKASYKIGSSMRPKQAKKRKRRKEVGMRWRTGIGVNRLLTTATALNVTFQDKDQQTILSLDGNIEAQDYEIFTPYDLDLFFGPWIIRWGISPEYFKNIYKEHSFGVGYELRLSQRRPFFLRGFVQHSHIIHALKLGQADNNYGDFKVSGDKFKSDKINVYYGSERHNLKTSLELAVGLSPATQLFFSATYMLPFSDKRIIYLWERDRLFLFRRRVRVPVSNDQVVVSQNEVRFDRSITDYNSFIFTIGFARRM